MQKNWFKLICLCTFLIFVIAIAQAKNSSSIVSAITISATINKLNQHAEIRWQALQNKKSMLRFELQKSADGTTFSYVTSVAGNNTNNVKPYFAEDRNLLGGNNFYRIRIIYKDGREGYSSVTQVSAIAPSVTIEPSVTHDNLYIWFAENSKVITASIVDASGKLINRNAAIVNKEGLQRIDVKDLSAGFYNVVIQTKAAENLHFKFVKK